MRLAIPIKVWVQRFAFLLLVGASFSLMLFSKAESVLVEQLRTRVVDAVAPILDAMTQPVATVNAFVQNVGELADLRSENQRLRAENERLRQWQSVARTLVVENTALRSVNNFVPDPRASFVTARVIGDVSGAYKRSMLLNAGGQDGVQKGQAAISGTGLVGRVNEVGARSARVLLLTDLNSRVPVVLERTRDRAILAGDNSDVPRLVHLRDGAQVAIGDRVVTSGDGGAFPPGLSVGVVTAISDLGIAVELFTDYARLEFVRVVEYGLNGILPPGADHAHPDPGVLIPAVGP